MISDQNGVLHVESSDPVTVWGTAHIATCPRCYERHGGSPVLGKPIPRASTLGEAAQLLLEGAEAVVITPDRKEGP